jgi:hypothetical protein
MIDTVVALGVDEIDNVGVSVGVRVDAIDWSADAIALSVGAAAGMLCKETGVICAEIEGDAEAEADEEIDAVAEADVVADAEADAGAYLETDAEADAEANAEADAEADAPCCSASVGVLVPLSTPAAECGSDRVADGEPDAAAGCDGAPVNVPLHDCVET